MIRPEGEFAKLCGALQSIRDHLHVAHAAETCYDTCSWGLIIRLWDGTYTTFLVLVSWAFFSGSTKFTWMSVCDILAGVRHQPDDPSSCASYLLLRPMCIRRDQRAAECPRAGALYSLDVFLNLHIGFVLSKSMRQRLLMDGRQVAHLYLFHGTLIVDVLAIIPVIPEVRREALAWLCIMPFIMLCCCGGPQSTAHAGAVLRLRCHESSRHSASSDTS